MMYVEFMKNFLLADCSKFMAVGLISASIAQRRLNPTLWTRCTSSSWKIFFSPIRASSWLLDSFRLLSPKTFESYFLDMMHVAFMKNFLLADSSKLMAVRLISASSEQKRFNPLLDMMTLCTSSSWKIFFSPIRASSWLLDSFRPPERKNVWILLSRHDVRRVHEKFSSRRLQQMAVGLISASIAQRRLNPTLWTRCTSSSWKIFFSPIQAHGC